MKILLDYNYGAHCQGNLLGYVGETNSRKITVEGYRTDGADLYKLRLSMPDKAEYEVDISSGEYTIPGSLLRTAGYVKMQVLAVKTNADGSYEYVKKSDVITGVEIRESVDGEIDPIPTYEDAAEALDKVLAVIDKSADYAKKSEQYADIANTAKTAAESASTAAQQAAADAATSYEGADKAAYNATQSAQTAADSADNASESERAVMSAKTDIESTALTISETAQEVSQNVTTVLQAAAIADNAKDIAVAKAEEISNSAEQIQRNKDDIAYLYNKADGIVCDAEGADIVVTDSSELPFKGMRIFGRSTQDGIPSPDDPVSIISVGDSGVITATVSDAEENAQTLTVSTPNGLPGIPVTSGGNYTDEIGQWVCDEVDFERGVYVQRIGSVVLDGLTHTEKSHTLIGSTTRYIFTIDKPCTVNNRMSLCSALKWQYSYGADNEHHYAQGHNVYIFISNTRLSEYENINEYLKEHPMRVIYQLADAVETPLTQDQIAAYKTLYAYKPTTVITNSDNAHMAVSYTADTKAYIDNKFAELIAAIISTGGNV